MFALYVRYVEREVTLVLIAACALLSQVGTTQNFEPLLAAVTAGLVIENLSAPQGDALRAAVQRGAPPILVVFFAAVGASLRLDALAVVGAAAVALSVFRLAMIRLGVVVGLRASGIDRDPGSYAWTGLISQAGITLGFGSIVAAEFPEWGANVQTLLVALDRHSRARRSDRLPAGTRARRGARRDRAEAARRGVQPGTVPP